MSRSQSIYLWRNGKKLSKKLRKTIEMAQPLNAIPNGSDLLIDANVFVYGLTAKSTECKTLLERCSNEEVFGITLFEIIHETTHVLMKGEAESKGLFTGPEKGVKYLTNHPEQVKSLTQYW